MAKKATESSQKIGAAPGKVKASSPEKPAKKESKATSKSSKSAKKQY